MMFVSYQSQLSFQLPLASVTVPVKQRFHCSGVGLLLTTTDSLAPTDQKSQILSSICITRLALIGSLLSPETSEASPPPYLFSRCSYLSSTTEQLTKLCALTAFPVQGSNNFHSPPESNMIRSVTALSHSWYQLLSSFAFYCFGKQHGCPRYGEETP